MNCFAELSVDGTLKLSKSFKKLINDRKVVLDKLVEVTKIMIHKDLYVFVQHKKYIFLQSEGKLFVSKVLFILGLNIFSVLILCT